MGTHPIFESDFDCLTDDSRCHYTGSPDPILGNRSYSGILGFLAFK